MSKMSLKDKLNILIEVSKSSRIFLLILMILLFLGFIYTKTNKKKNRLAKSLYLTSSVFIIVFFVTTYHSSLSSMFDYMMDNFFIAVYFPNLAIYAFALVVTNIILWVSIFNYKVSKVIKYINVSVYLIMNYLLSLVLNVINTNKLDIFTQSSVYGNEKATALIELSSLLFIIWVIFLILYRVILIYLKKEYKPPVKKLIRIKRVKKLPENFEPKENPVYIYGRMPVKKASTKVEETILSTYEKMFTVEDYKVMLEMLKKAKAEKNREEIKEDKIVEPNRTDAKQLQDEPIIIESEVTKVEKIIEERKKQEEERRKKELAEKQKRELELQERLRKEEQVKERRKFTELEELYGSMR